MLAYFGPLLDKNDLKYAGIVPFKWKLCVFMIFTMIWIKPSIEEFRSGSSNIVNVNDYNHTARNQLCIFYGNWMKYGLLEVGD